MTDRLLMLAPASVWNVARLMILNTETFTQVASLPLGTGLYGLTPSDLIYLGGDGVAVLSEASLFIFRSPVLASPP